VLNSDDPLDLMHLKVHVSSQHTSSVLVYSACHSERAHFFWRTFLKLPLQEHSLQDFTYLASSQS